MIIRFPTGLYKNSLVKAGNITFTISTQDPPKTEVRLTRLPVVEEVTPAPDKIFDDDTRREQFGELIYTIARTTRSDPGSSQRQFGLGEVLEFENEPPSQDLDSVLAPRGLDLQHNLHLIDLGSLGLSEEEAQTLVKDSQTKQKQLESDFNRKNIEVDNLAVAIAENQKKINETGKAIRAVRQVYNIPEADLANPNVVYQKLLAEQSRLEQGRDKLIGDRNSAAAELREISQAIVRVSEFVK